MKKILLIDNYDSFTYNLAHVLESFDNVQLEIVRNKNIPAKIVGEYDAVLLSPGPGIPSEAGGLLLFLEKYLGSIPILGICLGHQAIAEILGAKLTNTKKVYHGVSAKIENHSNQSGILKDLGKSFQAGRYHSWIVDKKSLPQELEVTAQISDGTIMAFQHRSLPVHGLQFHPESILTPGGKRILSNWVAGIAA